MDGIDLFQEYILFREGKRLHYDELKRGFILYSFPQANPDDCFIDDMFVLDSHRELPVVMGMIRFVEAEARKFGKKFMVAAVNVKKPDSERILTSHFWHKMKIIAVGGDFIYTRKVL